MGTYGDTMNVIVTKLIRKANAKSMAAAAKSTDSVEE
jgi:hypothetical protein